MTDTDRDLQHEVNEIAAGPMLVTTDGEERFLKLVRAYHRSRAADDDVELIDALATQIWKRIDGLMLPPRPDDAKAMTPAEDETVDVRPGDETDAVVPLRDLIAAIFELARDDPRLATLPPTGETP